MCHHHRPIIAPKPKLLGIIRQNLPIDAERKFYREWWKSVVTTTAECWTSVSIARSPVGPSLPTPDIRCTPTH